MDGWRVEIFFGVRGHGQENAIDVGGIAAAFNRGSIVRPRPIVVLHQDDEDRLNIVLGLSIGLCPKTQN